MTANGARTVLVNLKANTSGFTSAMSKARAEVQKADQAQTKAQRNAEKWKAVGVASQAAGAAMAAGLLYAANAAGQQEQAMRGLQAVFKDQAPLMQGYAEKAAAMGLSQAEYAQHASRLGAMLRNLGMEQNELGVTTDDLLRKSADMYAMFGHEQGLAGAVDAVAALLRKERDPIERFAVSVKDVGVKAEMAATGTDELHATLSLLHKQLEDGGTLGAYARNSDLLSVQLGQLQAEFKNAAAAIGKDLVPHLATAARTARTAFEAFNGLPGPIKALVGSFAALTSALLLLGPLLVKTGAHLTTLHANLLAGGAGAKRAAAAMTMLGTAAKVSALPLTALITVLGAIAVHQANVRARGEELVGTLDSLTGAVTELTHQNLTENFLADFSLDDFRDLQGMGLDLTLSDISRAAIEGGDALEYVLDQIGELEGGFLGATDKGWEGLNPFHDRVDAIRNAVLAARDDAQAMQELSEATREAGAASQEATTATDGMTQAQRRASMAVQTLRNDLASLVSLNLALAGSKDALIGQTQRLRDAITQNGAAYSGNTQAAVANRAAVDSEMQTILAAANAVYESEKALGDEGAAREKANAFISRHTAALMENAREAGFSAKAIREMKERIGEVKGKQVVVRAKPEGTKRTKGEIEDVHESARSLQQDEYEARVKAQGTSAAKGDIDSVTGAAESVPEDTETFTRTMNTAQAIFAINAVHASAIRAAGDYHVRMITTHEVRKAAGGFIRGMVRGPGSGTSDSIRARLSNGEYVLRAAAVRRLGVSNLDYMNSTGDIPADDLDGEEEVPFARGGRAGRRRRKRRQARRQAARQAAASFAAQQAAARAAYEARQREAQRQAREKAARREWEKEQAKIRRQRERAAKRAKLERAAQRARDLISRMSSSKKWAGKDRRLSEKEWRKLSQSKRFKNAQKAIRALERYDASTSRQLDRNSNAWGDGWDNLSDEERARRERQSQDERDQAEKDRIAEEARRERERQQVEKAMSVWDKYRDLAEAKLGFIKKIRDNLKANFGALTAFDFGKYKRDTDALKAAGDNLKQAGEGVAAARDALAKAGDGASRRSAQRALRDAKAEEARLLAERDKAAAEAAKSKATPANIMAAYKQQLADAQQYAASIQSLKRKGLADDILEQLATGDPAALKDTLAGLNGLTVAQIQQINSQQARIGSLGQALGVDLGKKFDRDLATAAVAVKVEMAATPVTLKIDGKTMAQALIDYQRRTGVSI